MNMWRRINRGFCLLLLFACNIDVQAQERLRVVSYNVENLFDTVDNPQTDDNEFLPVGQMRWSGYRYWTKLKNITRVLTAIGEMESPAIVGLVEVENDSVLFDLTKRSPLRSQKYEYICSNSPDLRGVNVGMLYQRDKFKFLEKIEYRVNANNPAFRPTRNILHVVGRVISGDTLDVFVCHFPSRRGGKAETEPYRCLAATVLRQRVDSLFSIRKSANVLIMGDFNDLPSDKSMTQILQAIPVSQVDSSGLQLVNLFLQQEAFKGRGTYYFQDDWDLIDHFTISSNLLNRRSAVRLVPGSARIFAPPFLCQKDEHTGEQKPFRTYLGVNYLGGFSDHFPIVMDLEVDY